jgi:hypothetical protein
VFASSVPAAVAGDTWIATPDGAVPVADLAPGVRPGTTADVEVKVVGLHGVPVCATGVSHLGVHPVLAIVAGDRELRCTPALRLASRAVVDGTSVLVWRAAGELAPGDVLALAEPAPVLSMIGPDPVLPAAEPVPGAPETGFFSWVTVELVAAIGEEPVYALGVEAPDQAYVIDGLVAAGPGWVCA